MTFSQLRLLLLSLVSFSSADYHIGVVLRSITFASPLNTLFDGSCCDSSCGTDQACCAATSCSPTLRLCFRESQRSREDTDSDCPLLEIDRTQANQMFIVMGMDNFAIERFYTGSFQVYVRISHSAGGQPDFEPPFNDPLIDEAFLEFSMVPPAAFEDRFSPITESLTRNGTFGRIRIEIRTSVHCAESWRGMACEFFCNPQCLPALGPPGQPTGDPPLPPPIATELPRDNTGGNNVAIAVGVSVGVVLSILVVIGVVVVIVVVKKKRSKNTPDVDLVTLKPAQKRISKSDIRVVTSLEPLNSGQMYASIDKKRKRLLDDDSDQEDPPPVPPYIPVDVDNYIALQGNDGVVYQNFSVVRQHMKK